VLRHERADAGGDELAFGDGGRLFAMNRCSGAHAPPGPPFGGDFVSVGMPQGLAHSMCRQKAEALLGAPILMVGLLRRER